MPGGVFGIGGYGVLADSGGPSASDVSSARSQSTQNRNEVKFLRANLERTLLICEALWELLRDKAHLTEDDLNNKLYEIDMRDGQLDGKNQRKVIDCPKCHRKVAPRNAACLYCGHIIDETVFAMSQ